MLIALSACSDAVEAPGAEPVGTGGLAAGGAAPATGTGGAMDAAGGTAGSPSASGGLAPSGGAPDAGGDDSGTSASGGTTGGAPGGGSAGMMTGGTSEGGAPGGSGTGGATSGGAAAGGMGAGGATSGGMAPSAGEAGTGAAAGSAGAAAGSAGEAGDGCRLTQEGFSTLSAMGQNGTTGGADGETVTVMNQAELDQYATASEPYVIRVQGHITLSPKGTEIRVTSNKTIIGVGDDAAIVEGGFFLNVGVHNVIIRNLTIRDSYVPEDPEGKDQDWDGIQLDTAHHVWIDHCHLMRMGDGLIDSRKDTTYLTVSWNILSDHNKAFGIGWTDNLVAEMTIHHNFIRDTNQRNPSTDNVLRAHLFNNFLRNVESYGNYSRGGTNMVLQNSVFLNVKDPHYYDDGTLVAIGNEYRGTSGQTESSGTSFSFFDPGDYYSYTLDPVSEVEDLLDRCAGPRPELGN